MLDKNILDIDVFKNKKIEIKISKPFNSLSIDFIADFSKELRKYKKINLYPDLVYLIFWCAKNKSKSQSYNNEKNLKLGRGLIFHICPSNVPTNFVYSFFPCIIIDYMLVL